MIEIHRIATDHPLYPQECRLREDVLLRDAGYDMASFVRDYPYEDRFEHYVAVLDHPAGPAVIGCALLLPDVPAPGVGKVMQVAVDPQRRGEGIGRRLMTTIEGRAFGELGLVRLFCHAQITAVDFYKRLGWTIEGDLFIEAGIQHFKMIMLRSDSSPDASLGPDSTFHNPNK